MRPRKIFLLFFVALVACLDYPDNISVDRLPPSFQVITFNIRVGNSDVQAIRRFVLSANAPIVALQEYRSSTHRSLLDDLQPRYRFQTVCQHGSHAVVLLSKFQPLAEGCLELGHQATRSFAWVRVAGAEGAWTFASVHLSHPLTNGSQGGLFERLSEFATATAEQLSQFDDLSAFAREHQTDSRMVVMGDFNAEPAWPHFRGFFEITGLRPVPEPPATRAVGGMGLAIDHVLVGPGAAIHELRTGPYAGSDHRSVIAVIGPDEMERRETSF